MEDISEDVGWFRSCGFQITEVLSGLSNTTPEGLMGWEIFKNYDFFLGEEDIKKKSSLLCLRVGKH